MIKSQILLSILLTLGFCLFSQKGMTQPSSIRLDPKEISVKEFNHSQKNDASFYTKEKAHKHIDMIDDAFIDKLFEKNGVYDKYTLENGKDGVISNTVVSEATLKKHLEYLNKITPIEIVYNEKLYRVINYMLSHRMKFFKEMKALSNYYFPIFEEELIKQDIPMELKYLAIIESELNPKAKSRVGATGLWQFMYRTAKMYGLKMDSYVDERLDPLKSTEKACKYLKDLYDVFGDWSLVLAAYNSGPGNVSKAIRRSGGMRDYWKLRKYLPKETALYYPKFIACLYVMEYSEYYDIVQKKGALYYAEVDTLKINKRTSLSKIARVIDIPLKEIEYLNTVYKKDIIPVRNSKDYYTVRIPIKKISTFIKREDEIYGG